MHPIYNSLLCNTSVLLTSSILQSLQSITLSLNLQPQGWVHDVRSIIEYNPRTDSCLMHVTLADVGEKSRQTHPNIREHTFRQVRAVAVASTLAFTKS